MWWTLYRIVLLHFVCSVRSTGNLIICNEFLFLSSCKSVTPTVDIRKNFPNNVDFSGNWRIQLLFCIYSCQIKYLIWSAGLKPPQKYSFFLHNCSLVRLHSVILAVVWWLGVWLAVCHVRALCWNGWWYDHSCYGMRIGNCMKAFELYHFQWPWVI